MRRRVGFSIVWAVLAGIFFTLTWQLFGSAGAEIPVFDPSQPKFEVSGEGFHLELEVEGTPLDKPFRDFKAEVNSHLEATTKSLESTRRRAAWACAIGGVASLVCLALVWLQPSAGSPNHRGKTI